MNLNSWRYRCPRGHTNFDDEGDAIYCQGCHDRGWPSWHRAIEDQRTGERIEL